MREFVVIFGLGFSLLISEGEEVSFNRDIRPILSDRCFACHGFDEKTREGDLRLDTFEGSREVIEEGNAEDSELFRRIWAHDADELMPPPETNKPLSDAERGLLKRWIEEGAKYESHWAYLAPEREDVGEGAIDHYVAEGLEGAGLKASGEAERWRLVRRVYQDLIGLPPTGEELEAGLKMSHEELVEELLKSPHFGERMAVRWLDLVRYADSVGYHGDQLVSTSPYRDYVIRAFNENKGFDVFTREQLAGDLLPGAGEEQLVASGYNRLNMTTEEGGAQPKEYLAKYSADRVRTTATVWMGGTLGCAECHDHKFDPYSIKDFYAMAAFFADLEEVGKYSGRTRPPQIFFFTDEEKGRLAELEGRIAELKKGELDEAGKKELKKLEDDRVGLRYGAMSMVVSRARKPREIRVLPRGNWMDDSGEVVEPAIPEFLGKIELGEGQERLSRLDLANWLTSRENPLTARVFVNRLWKEFYGVGISKVLDDLGNQGEWPTHPELLDWLAVEFMESGWDVKHVVKLMVTSEVYRRDSRPRSELREVDPYNRLFARQASFRMDGEHVRDAALSVSGLLVRKMGGRSARPYQPAGYYQHLNFPRRKYVASVGEDQYRRGVYTHWQRTFLHPMMKTFDAPSRDECVAERPSSNTPLQALVLLNDPTFVEAARVFAERVVGRGGSFEERLDFAFREALSRGAREREVKEMRDLYEKSRTRFEGDEEGARAYLKVGDRPVRVEDAVEGAAWMSVTRVILNLRETVARY